MTQTVLIIEDDHKAAELIRLYLEKDNYHVLITDDGYEGLEMARQQRPDLIVLDIMLPTLTGHDICRILRADQNIADVPIIMLTAKSTEDDKLLGIGIGADDYVTKPFSPRELVARVQMVLRRTQRTKAKDNEVKFGDLQVNFDRYEVLLEGKPISLTPKEFSLLKAMIQKPGHVFSRDDLMTKAFGFDYEGLARTVDVHVMKLRKKIETDISQPRYIQTVYGIGYKFSDTFYTPQ